ncbi:N-acetylmuramoyl-L-alanine amidase, partial [bacterium]|nr:N-acetylmuramoyl-L-alanine amidase [bacterium]
YEDNEFDIYEFYLMKKVPYKIEESPLKLTIFNLKNSRGLFTIQPTLCHKPVGFNGEYEGDKFVLKVRKFPKISSIKPLEKVKIVIDPGHGGSEPGAIGCSGIAEKDIVMQISKYLQRELKHMGATVILTREDDSYVDLYDRVKFTNDNDAIIFISIHANATPDSWNPNEHSGTSVYYYYEQAKPLAESILSSTVEIAETNNDGIYQRSFAVVRNTKALSVLVETAYMINPDDIAKLEQIYFQKNIAKGISQGIVNFFKTSVLP